MVEMANMTISLESGERAFTKHRKLQAFVALVRPKNAKTAVSLESDERDLTKHGKIHAFVGLGRSKMTKIGVWLESGEPRPRLLS